MSNYSLTKDIDEYNKEGMKEINMQFEISQKLKIDKDSKISDLKQIARKCFSKYADNITLFIHELDITSFENMNTIRTLEYYRTNQIIVRPIYLKNNLNSPNEIFLMNETLGKNNEVLFNFNEMKKKINSLIKENDKSDFNVYTNIEGNKPYKIESNNQSFKKQSKSQLNKISDSICSNNNHEIKNKNYSNYLNYHPEMIKSSVSPIVSERSSHHLTSNSKTHNKLTNSVNFHPIKLSRENSNINNIVSHDKGLYSEREKDEMEFLIQTNRMLNKSDLDLKKQIKILEEELEANKDAKLKVLEINNQLENFKNSLINMQEINSILQEENQIQKKSNNEYLTEIKKLKHELETMIKNNQNTLKMNIQYKQNLEEIEIFNQKKGIECNELNNDLNMKDKTISELQEKIKCLTDLYNITNKSCRDYEDVLNGLKKSIDIIKHSNDNSERETVKLRANLDEANIALEKKIEDYQELERVKTLIQNENEMLKNEVTLLKNALDSKYKNLDENQITMRTYLREKEAFKIKEDNISKMINEKDKIIDNMKNYVFSLNKNLEDSRNEINTLKNSLTEETSSKNKLAIMKDQFESNCIEQQNKLNELIKSNQNFKEESSSLEKEVLILKNNNYKLKNENDGYSLELIIFKDKVSDLQKENNSITNSLTTLKDEKNSFLSRIEELNDSVNKLKSNNFSLNNDIDNMNSRNIIKERTIETLIKSKEELNQEIYNLKDKIKQISNGKQRVIEEFDLKNNELKSFEKRYQRDVDKFMFDISSKDNLISILEKKVSDLKEKMEETLIKKEKEIISLGKSVEGLKKKLSEINENLAVLKVEKEDTSNDLKLKNKLVNDLHKNVDDLSVNILSLKSKNDRLTSLNKEKEETESELKKKIMDNEKIIYKANSSIDNLKNNVKDLQFKVDSLQNSHNSLKLNNDKLENQIKILNGNSNLDIMKLGSQKSVSSLVNTNSNIKLNTNSISGDSFKENDSIRYLNEKNTSNKKIDTLVSNQICKEDNSQFITSEVNLKLSKRKADKLPISEGSKILLNVFDNKRILRFDLENRMFRLIEFADFGNFEKNYKKNAVCLNLIDGLFILTGENSDQFFYYSNSKHSMVKLSKLNENHNNAGLIYLEQGNCILCISGTRTKIVEKYVNEDLINPFFKSGKKTLFYDNQSKNTWNTRLPELGYEKSEGIYTVVENKFIYSFFGYDNASKRYVDTVERLSIENPVTWETITVKSDKKFIAFRKDLTCVTTASNEILFIGGFNINENSAIDTFSSYKINENEFVIENKRIAESSDEHYYFKNTTFPVSSIDTKKNCIYSIFDDKNNVHIIDNKYLQDEIITFII